MIRKENWHVLRSCPIGKFTSYWHTIPRRTIFTTTLLQNFSGVSLTLLQYPKKRQDDARWTSGVSSKPVLTPHCKRLHLLGNFLCSQCRENLRPGQSVGLELTSRCPSTMTRRLLERPIIRACKQEVSSSKAANCCGVGACLLKSPTRQIPMAILFK